MKYRALGSSGIEASVIGIGTWAIGGWMWGGTDEKESIRAVHASMDRGVNLIDTAPVYGFGVSEELVGKAIAGIRQKVVLATKCGLVWDIDRGDFFFSSDEHHPDAKASKYKVFKYLSPASIRLEVEKSLRRLGTDYIDLYQTHWQESTTAIADTMGELVRLKEEGKIRAIGVSNATSSQMQEYASAGTLDSDQENFSMLHRKAEEDQLPCCRKNDTAFLSYSTLAQGLLTGKMGPDRTFEPGDQRNFKPLYSMENRVRVAELLTKFTPIAENHGASLAQICLAWTFHQPGCSHVLVGARTAEQGVENATAGDIDLSPEEIGIMTALIDEMGAI